MSAILFLAVTALSAAPVTGPLRVHPTNPRYFTDGTKNADGSLKAVYLTGSHVWGNLQDYGYGIGYQNPPPVFDYAAYLDLMHRHGHNFMRMWAWEAPQATGGRAAATLPTTPPPCPANGRDRGRQATGNSSSM